MLAANIAGRREVARLRSWYIRERSRRYQARRYRILSGAGWSQVVDSLSGIPFWWNQDTGQALYERPAIVEAQEHYAAALELRYNGLHISVLINILSFLVPHRDRQNAALVCSRWSEAAKNSAFFKRVLSVELGAKESEKVAALYSNQSKFSKRTSRVHSGTETGSGSTVESTSTLPASESKLAANEFTSVGAAIAAAVPGDTILLTSGHHWESNLLIDKPLKIVSESEDPQRCILELSGRIDVLPSAARVFFCGLTLRYSFFALVFTFFCTGFCTGFHSFLHWFSLFFALVFTGIKYLCFDQELNCTAQLSTIPRHNSIQLSRKP